jgi:NAD(P)-dependent dehydrogenase (short-subunit alcohol dehydrogenase family)
VRDPLFDLAGKQVLFAGGASGLGRALAEAFAARGAHCLVADIDSTAARAAAASLPGSGHAGCYLDVCDPASCAQAVDRAAESGGLDVLINSAGRLHLAPALELDSADFESVLRLNAAGAFLVAREAARAMKAEGGGRIITIASVSSQVANANYAAYATSKGALIQLTRILALEWAPHGITVNAIGPAMTPTAMTQAHLAEPEARRQALEHIPMGRFGAPEDIFGAAILLAAPAGAFITGQILYVDGGRTLK